MSGSRSDHSVEPTSGLPGKAVDKFFHKRSRYWRDVYQANTLSAFIYRQRQSTVLSMVDNLGLPEGSRILEVGCGAGSTSVVLAQMGYRVNAIDTVEEMLNFTRQAAAEAGVDANVQTSAADICQLSFASRYFDLVVAIGVVPWLGNLGKALMELYRVTRRGGYVILTSSNSWCLNHVMDPLCFPGLRPIRWQIAEVLEKFKLWNRSRPRQYRYSIKQTDRLISRAGLAKIEGRTLGFGPFTVFKQNLFPKPAGIKVHKKLQTLAEHQIPVIRSCGVSYAVLAQKP